ncbi:MAG: glycosyltransferase [Rhodobacteraceae bacterium]|nr:glycosyltransferase [Paracoccaceae bacterium]
MISVVIPHFNQPSQLAGCLASLVPQAAGGHEVEIIVVDNGSREMPVEVVARFPRVRLLHEALSGPGPARNAGIAAAAGDILAFIDADMVAAPGWLAAIAGRFRDPAAGILGGDVQILLRNPAAPTALECYEAEYSFRMEHYIARQGFTGTGNLAVRRAVLDDVGPFAGIGVAEDRDWGRRATAKGHRILWAPEMLALHPARESFAELARKWDRQTAHDFAFGVTGWRGRARWIAKMLAMPLSPLAGIPRILRSRRIPGGLRGRLKAFAVLARIRLYRARLMAGLAFAGNAGNMADRWRDDGGGA